MFRSMNIIWELVLHLTKVVFVLKHKYNFSQVQYKLPDDVHRPKHVGAILMCILMQILKLFRV